MEDFQRGLVIGLAVSSFIAGILFLWFAISASSRSRVSGVLEEGGNEAQQSRIQRADDSRERRSPLARYVVSAVGFAMGGALLAHFVTPALAYTALCLALALRSAADQVAEERAPRRRSALIGRSRYVDPVLLTWIALAGISSIVLIPWLLDETYRFPAVLAAACVLTMIWLAWRIASAPPLLFGDDLEAEQVVDRETRAIRTGNMCFLTLCVVAVFTSFVGGPLGYASHGIDYHGINVLHPALLLLCFGLFGWRWLYARHLSRTPLPT